MPRRRRPVRWLQAKTRAATAPQSMDPCSICGMADDHDDGECFLGSPSPGADRRAWLKKKAPVEGTGAREALLPPLAGRGHGLDLDDRPVLAQKPAIL